MVNYDLLGNIAIIKGEGKSSKEKLKQAKEILKRPSVKTVLEKLGNIKGRLRTINTKFIAGEKNKIALVKENNCLFKFDVDNCYFSPRLSGERKLIIEKIKKNDRVLVMFAGVGVYPIVIAKNSKPKEIVAVELGKECCKYFKENLKINKISSELVKIVQGDVKKKVNKSLGKFDLILMPRPNLKDSFLESALSVSKKGSRIIYNGFGHVDELEKIKQDLIDEADKLGRKIKIIKTIRAGDIAPYKFRYRIEIKVLN